MKILIFGAGSTGRGHLATLLYENGYKDITFIDKDKKLVEILNKSGFYHVNLFGSVNRLFKYDNVKILDRQDEDVIISEMLDSDLVITAVFAENLEDISIILAKGIAARLGNKINKPLNIVACENLNNASSLLKKKTHAKLSEEEIMYADEYVGFPDAIISRVVPLAKENPLYMIAEDYNEWFVRKSDFKGDDPKIPCITLSDNLEALLERKLWIHNGGHATVAYAGLLKGHKYIHEAVDDPVVGGFSLKTMNQIGKVISHKHGFEDAEVEEYITCFVKRGQIIELKDDLLRVVRDPIRKLGVDDRLIGPALYACANGLDYDYIIRSVVNVLRYDNPNDSESLLMQNTIKNNGVRYFLKNLIKIPDEKLCKSIEEEYTKWSL